MLQNRFEFRPLGPFRLRSIEQPKRPTAKHEAAVGEFFRRRLLLNAGTLGKRLECAPRIFRNPVNVLKRSHGNACGQRFLPGGVVTLITIGYDNSGRTFSQPADDFGRVSNALDNVGIAFIYLPRRLSRPER